jgi:hypothetical protein
MVAVILRNDDVANRLVGHRPDELLQESRLRRIVAGVHDHHALAGHDHQSVGVVELTDESIDVVGDFLELGLVARHGLRRSGYSRGRAGKGQGKRPPFHRSLP